MPINSQKVVCQLLFNIKLWWALVTAPPEESRIAVFSRGIENGFIL